MKTYYYLNEQKEPQGPHTLDELRALLATGKLTENTLAAPHGGSKWLPLPALLANPAPPASEAMPAGDCPVCGTAIQATDGRLPERCSACGYRLRAVNPNDLWQSFMLAIRKTFVLRGRATRMEFWSFILFSILLTFVVQTATQIGAVLLMSPADVASLSTNQETFNPDLFSTGATIAMMVLALVYFLFTFLITIPQITVTIRRLHDVGRSGKWLLANIVLTIVAFCGTIGFFATAFSESSRIREAEYVQVDGEWYHKDNLPTRDEEMMSGDSELRLHNPASAPEMHMWVLRGLKADFPVRVLLLGALLPMGLAGLISLYILILCFIDSHRGPNRYGPSSKYPTA